MNELRLFEVPPLPEEGPSKEEIMEVFSYWMNAMGKREKTTKLTEERSKKIKRALTWFPREKLFDAIDGCKNSKFHMGSNDRGKVYNDIEMIVRTEERIQMLAGIMERDRAEQARRLKAVQEALEGK